MAHKFGPSSHSNWAFDGDRIDLVRTRTEPIPIHIDATPQPLTVDLGCSALIVVDMQNDFCHPQGWFGQKGIDVAPMRRAIAPIARLLPTWRSAGGTVIWLNWGIRADRLNLSPLTQFKGKRSASGTMDAVGYAEHSPIDHGPSLVKGEWGAAHIEEFEPDASDITVHKHRLSGFWDNELDTLLRLRGTTTLFFAGVNTDRCVFSTLQDAGFLGYDCILLEDACSTPSPEYVTRAIHFIVQQLHGFTSNTTTLLAGLAAAAACNAPLTPTPPSTEGAPR